MHVLGLGFSLGLHKYSLVFSFCHTGKIILYHIYTTHIVVLVCACGIACCPPMEGLGI